MNKPKSTCCIEDCESSVVAKSLCDKHYRRLKRKGRLDLMTEEERFWSWVNISDPESCWEWKGHKNKDGYGRFVSNKKRYVSSRFSYTISKGDIPDDLLVCHSCDNPSCVNPEHLFLGSYTDNNRDTVNKGRTNPRKGDNHPHAKITEAQVEEIKMLLESGISNKEIAERYGVSVSHIRNIKYGHRRS